jgi:hypothetical protein
LSLCSLDACSEDNLIIQTCAYLLFGVG